VTPEQFGCQRADIKALSVASAAESLALIESALMDKQGPARDIVALNAGAAIYAAGVAATLDAGVRQALAVIATGAALDKMRALAGFSQKLMRA
jgi:anthranilate phosphoribosyltransferase